jgi:hypothetical protein
MIHYELSREEHRMVSEAARQGGQFDLWEALCRTGDGHREGTRVPSRVTCPQCIQTMKTFLKYSGVGE